MGKRWHQQVSRLKSERFNSLIYPKIGRFPLPKKKCRVFYTVF